MASWVLFGSAVGLLGGGFLRAQETKKATELRVAAASDLQPVMPAVAAAYEKATGVKLLVSFGSSSSLATQIVNGAPVDVFLSADHVAPEKVVAAEKADTKAPTPYAKGTLVLWARKDSPLQPITIDTLSDKRVKRIAVADELHAPYGRAAIVALRYMKVLDEVRPRLVTAENVAQAAQFAESGNADLGLISLTLAESEQLKNEGTYVRIPKVYPTITQCAVVMKGARQGEGDAFLKWLLTSAVQQELVKMGLEAVQ